VNVRIGSPSFCCCCVCGDSGRQRRRWDSNSLLEGVLEYAKKVKPQDDNVFDGIGQSAAGFRRQLNLTARFFDPVQQWFYLVKSISPSILSRLRPDSSPPTTYEGFRQEMDSFWSSLSSIYDTPATKQRIRLCWNALRQGDKECGGVCLCSRKSLRRTSSPQHWRTS
jgi:hypothetical protein